MMAPDRPPPRTTGSTVRTIVSPDVAPATALTGVIPPVCTPLTDDREVDGDSLRRLLDHLVDGGVDGLFLLGSSSEAAFLTDDQRDEVLRIAVPHVAGRVPVIAGVIDMTTPRVLQHVRRALDAGVGGVVATAPFYTRTHVAEIEVHFSRIKEAIGDVPLFAYDIPVCVNGVKLDPAMVLRLAADGVLAGVKDSSGDDAGLRALVLSKRSAGLADFSVLTGSELTVDSAMLMGADGVVPGLGNVDPVGYATLVRLARAGDWAGARAEQERLCALFGLVSVGAADRMGRGSSAMGAFKAGLYLRKVIATPTTALPAIPLSESEIDAVAGYLERGGLL
jgi:4-hydroxy-tetrahydrodipicolinate synthase